MHINSNHVDLIPWDCTFSFKQSSLPLVPKAALQNDDACLRKEECSSLFLGIFTSHSSLISPTLTIVKITHFLVLLTFSVDTAHLCTSSWWKFTMTSFYRPISNSQLHLTTAAAYVSVASTTVFTPQSAALRLLLIKVEYYSTSSTFFGDVSTAFNSVANFILIGEGILTSSRTFVS
jgi:hypothetical protein